MSKDFFYSFVNNSIKEPQKFDDCDCEIVSVSKNGECTVKSCKGHELSIRDNSIKYISFGPATPENWKPIGLSQVESSDPETIREKMDRILFYAKQTHDLTDEESKEVIKALETLKKYDVAVEEYIKLNSKYLNLVSENFVLEQQIKQLKEQVKLWQQSSHDFENDMKNERSDALKFLEENKQLKKENEKIKEFYVCMHCHHLARLKEISKNSELRMCPHCQTQMKSFYQILKEEKDVQ